MIEDETYHTYMNIADAQDKKKGALVVVEGRAYSDADHKELAFVNTMNLFIRGIGGFEAQPPKYKTFIQIPKIPERAPDAVLKEVTRPDQAILYRLSGDYNPLHIDPEMAKMGNFDKPILHGLCFYGICAKNVLKHFGNYNSANFKEISARFTSFVFPGETIIINVLSFLIYIEWTFLSR